MFIVLVVGLSTPLWAIGALTGLQLVPGLPVSALMAFCPLTAAAMLTYRESGTEGTKALVRRAFDAKRIKKVWYLPTLFLTPAIAVLSYALLRSMGAPLPKPRVGLLTPLVLLAVFFVAGVGEEVGWSGYVTDRMQQRWTALQTGLLLGLVWALWHVIPNIEAHRSLSCIAWQGLNTVAQRVLIIWLYNNTGRSVFATIVFHGMSNVSWLMFPDFGSHFDPKVTGLLTASAAAVVAVVWGSRTLTRSHAV
jgi:uncharacterized protein